MKIDDFFNKAKDDSVFGNKSRLLIIRNRQEQKQLRQRFEERPNRFAWVRLSKCVSAITFVPPADQVLEALRAEVVKVNASGRIAYITGLSAILAVWNSAERVSAFELLRSMVDDFSLHFYVFVNGYGDDAQQVFSHPRYAEGKSILVVGESVNDEETPDIRLVSNIIGNFITGANRSSLSAYLNDFEIGGFGSQPINIRFDADVYRIAAVSRHVKQIFRSGDYLREFCSYSEGLSVEAEEWLFMKMLDSGAHAAAKDYLQGYFFPEGMSDVCIVAPRMIILCSGAEQEALVWFLKQSILPYSYLYRVLTHSQFDIGLFKSMYVNVAIDAIGAANERSLCSERRKAIAAILQDGSISLEAEIAKFINETKDVDPYQIVPWLSNKTKLEIDECIRRLRHADLSTLPQSFYEAVPLIEDYLKPYALGDSDLEDYFTRYRTHKVANNVTAEFCELARNVKYPIMGVASRDSLLTDPALDGAALLVVDALGLEYLPMIISLALRRGLDIANAVPASVKLPTSTKFNPIQWAKGSRLNGIPDLDNIIHNGAHMHGHSSDEENFIAMLKVFDERIMPTIATALALNGKVVLTADHGASRLAVLANREHLSKTLPVMGVDAKAEDWRYLAADPNAVPPASVASNVSGSYWVAKGYDRFSKSGGKLNELHGGLTYEEVLVPFVVFEKGATFVPMTANVAPVEQFVENDDFDL